MVYTKMSRCCNLGLNFITDLFCTTPLYIIIPKFQLIFFCQLSDFNFLFLALFMLRDPAFLSKVPAEHKKHFIDSEPLQLCKMDILKKMVKDRFPVNITTVST